MNFYGDYYSLVESTAAGKWLPGVKAAAERNFAHGKLHVWLKFISSLQVPRKITFDFSAPAPVIGLEEECGAAERGRIQEILMKLHPWRKGPFSVFGVFVDSEWKSNLKWARLEEHISPLKGRLVLDVGCGNGYYCFRMAAHSPELIMGIDPSMYCVAQYLALSSFTTGLPAAVLPLRSEELPQVFPCFDTVFSMGVIYHRKSPLEHLEELRSFLRSGGECVLETLCVEGPEGYSLVPSGRYAKMRNVHFVPSLLTAENWLDKSGFRNIRLVDVTKTSFDEQRKTSWMRFESLADFLDPSNPELTIESYPAPRRALFIADAR